MHLGAVSDALRKDTHSALQESEDLLQRYRQNNEQFCGLMEERKQFVTSDVLPTKNSLQERNAELRREVRELQAGTKADEDRLSQHLLETDWMDTNHRRGYRGLPPFPQKPLRGTTQWQPDDWEAGRKPEEILGPKVMPDGTLKPEHSHANHYITGPSCDHHHRRVSSLRMIQATHGAPVHKGPHTTKFYIGAQ